MARLRVSYWMFVLVAFVGCAAQSPVPSISLSQQQQLLSGKAEWELVGVDIPAADTLLELDDDMRAFAKAYIPQSKTEWGVREILSALTTSGMLGVDYHVDKTYSAEDVFYYREGNCLSFSYLFVALARERGFKAKFQRVELPPVWSGDGQTLIMQKHINVLVRLPKDDVTADFNVARYNDSYPKRVISDEEALADYYNNHGVNALLDEDYAKAFQYFREGLRHAPNVAHLWLSLGVLYGRTDDLEKSQWAYRRALQEDPANSSAMLNLSRIYDLEGDKARADALAKDALDKRYKNPYYRYALAQNAYSKKNYQESVSHLTVALKKREDHHFYYLLGLNKWFLGERKEAINAFEKAKNKATATSDQYRYSKKLNAMAANF